MNAPAPTPGTLVLIGLAGVVVVNAATFVANLLVALLRMRGARDENEIEERMVPAFEGVPSELGSRVLRAAVVLVWVFMGIAAAGVLWLAARWALSAA